MSETAAESTAVMLQHEHVTTMTAYVQQAQNDGTDGLPVSGDALTVMRKGNPTQRRREHAARLRMAAL